MFLTCNISWERYQYNLYTYNIQISKLNIN